MSTAGNKTVKTACSPEQFLSKTEPAQKRADSFRLLEMMKDITDREPEMWGTSIVGFGEYHYKYNSGREGDMCRVGFSPRAQNLVIYLMPGFAQLQDELARLGKHKLGKSCLYIKHLSDVDEGVLRQIIARGLAIMEKKYPL